MCTWIESCLHLSTSVRQTNAVWKVSGTTKLTSRVSQKRQHSPSCTWEPSGSFQRRLVPRPCQSMETKPQRSGNLVPDFENANDFNAEYRILFIWWVWQKRPEWEKYERQMTVFRFSTLSNKYMMWTYLNCWKGEKIGLEWWLSCWEHLWLYFIKDLNLIPSTHTVVYNHP